MASQAGGNITWTGHKFLHVDFEAIMDFPLCTMLENLHNL